MRSFPTVQVSELAQWFSSKLRLEYPNSNFFLRYAASGTHDRCRCGKEFMQPWTHGQW